MNATKENKKETNIQVVVRIRPPSEKEILDGYPISITPKGSNQVVAITPHATTTRTFSFDKVFSQHGMFIIIFYKIIVLKKEIRNVTIYYRLKTNFSIN